MITEFQDGFITKTKLNELVGGINDINSKVLTTDITKTVGIGGDFTTLNLALSWCRSLIPDGHKVTLQLMTGFIMSEQILLENVNLGFVTISSIDATVMVTSSAINTVFIVGKPIFGGIDSIMPVIDVYFKLDNIASSNSISGVNLEGMTSYCRINTSKGFENLNFRPIFSWRGAKVRANGFIAKNCKGGIQASDNGEILALSCNINTIYDPTNVYAYKGAKINVSSAILTTAGLTNISCENSEIISTYATCSGATYKDVVTTEGGIVKFNNSTGTLSQTANTITADGIIFK